MRRPFFTAGTTVLTVLILLCQADSIYVTVGCCGLFSVLFILCVLNKRNLRTFLLPTVFLSAVVSCCLFISYESLVYAPYYELSDREEYCEFTLTEYPTYNKGRYYCMSRYKDEKGKTYKVRLSLPSVSKTDFEYENMASSLEPGDAVRFEARLYTFGNSSKALENSYKSRGLFLGAIPKGEITVEKTDTVSLMSFLKREKKRTVNLLLSSFDIETASIGVSLLMGDKNLLDNGTYETVKNAGVSHLLAVSGLHLSVWIMFVMKAVEVTGLNKRKTVLFLLAFDFLVMFFASFSGSVMRAGIMMAVHLLGTFVKKNSDSLNSLGVSAIIILFSNPYSSMNVSFLLSFVASYSIIAAATPIITKTEETVKRHLHKTYLRKIFSLVLPTVTISVTVSVYTLPIMAYFFSQISLTAVLTNLLLVPVSTNIVISFGLYVMLWFMPVLSAFLKGISFVFTEYLLFCVNLTGGGALSTVNIQLRSFIVALSVTAVMFVLPFIIGVSKEKREMKKFSGKVLLDIN